MPAGRSSNAATVAQQEAGIQRAGQDMEDNTLLERPSRVSFALGMLYLSLGISGARLLVTRLGFGDFGPPEYSFCNISDCSCYILSFSRFHVDDTWKHSHCAHGRVTLLHGCERKKLGSDDCSDNRPPGDSCSHSVFDYRSTYTYVR
jgi:hypothetical protein